MRVERLKIKDFCVIGEADVPMAEQGLVLVSGSNCDSDAADNNGSGKTTLFKALTWCLYGATIDGDKAAKIIRQGADKASVRVDLVDNEGETWVIERERGKSEKLSIHGPSGAVVESKEGLQARVEKLLGFDFRSFCSTVLYGQQDSARFAGKNTTDSQRKDILHRILKTSLLKHCEKHVRTKLKEIEDEIAPIKSKAEAAQAALDEYDLDELKRLEREYEEERAEEIQKIEEEMSWAKAALKKTEARRKELPKAIIALEREIESAGNPAENREKISKILDKAVDRIAKAGSAISALRATEEQLAEKLEMLDGDECPVCSSPLTDSAPAEHIEYVLAEISDVRERIDGLNKILKKCGKQRDKAREMMRECDEEAERIAELHSKKSRLAEENFKIREKANNANKEIDLLLRRKANAEELKNPHKALRARAEERVKALKKNAKEISKSLEEKDAELAHYKYWAKGFSSQGLPSFILDSVMPILTERTNHYLETLSDGDITMRFSTRTTLKTGGVRDKIDISWVLEGSEGTTPSQGQQRKMEVATDLALMDLAESREGGSVDLLLLDEVLDGLDAAGRARIVDLLHELRAKRRSIFVISHDPMMAEVFEKVVTLVKRGQVSTLEAA